MQCQKCKVHTQKQYSTESALLRFFSDICRALDGGNVCLVGLLDLSAACETVDHHILLKKLETSFGVNEPALELLRSYLTDRTQMMFLTSLNQELRICGSEYHRDQL